MDLLSKIENEFNRLEVLGQNNYIDVRNKKNYILSERYGRPCYDVPEDKYKLYIDLQASRGLNSNIKNNVKSHIEKIKRNSLNFPINSDSERITEVDHLFSNGIIGE